MNRAKKIVATFGIIGLLSISGMAFADSVKTPASIASELTGKSITTVTEARLAGTTYGAQALDAGQLEAFKAQMLELKEAILKQRVADGVMTQAEADRILDAIKDNMDDCDGTGAGSARIGRGAGAGFGCGIGGGQGLGAGQGLGRGMRNGGGIGFGRTITE